MLTFGLVVNTLIDVTGKVSPSTSTALIGMVLGGTVGFLLDNMIGSEDGYRATQSSFGAGALFAFRRLASGAFARYSITVFFDVFVTVILFKPLFLRLVQLPFFHKEGFGQAMANGVVTNIIGTITFFAYANMTRFQWAYPSESAGRDSWIKGTIFGLIVVVMAIVYLTANTQLVPGERGINSPGVKIGVVLAVFTLMGGLFFTNQMDQGTETETPPVEDDASKENSTSGAQENTDVVKEGGDGEEECMAPLRPM